MAQNDQPPIAGWCYPTMAMIRNLWVIGTIILSHCQMDAGKPWFWVTAMIAAMTRSHQFDLKGFNGI